MKKVPSLQYLNGGVLAARYWVAIAKETMERKGVPSRGVFTSYAQAPCSQSVSHSQVQGEKMAVPS